MSIIRPEKRDPNHIKNKSDIGLSKVDNVSSAEFASIVLDQVKRHLNRETIYQTSGRRFIALAKITCKSDGSGNLIKILSGNLFITFAVLNESEDVQEAAKLEAIYTHYTNGTESDDTDDTAKVEYNLFMTENPSLLNECYIEFRENIFENAEGNKINEMYVILRCDSANLPFVSVNLFEYSKGGVAVDPIVIEDNTLASYTLIKSIKCDHNRFSLVDRSESTIGFEIYDSNGNPIRVKETDDSIDPTFDIPRINGVPFTGRRNVFVDGKDTRQIDIKAKHSGSNIEEAGEHDWSVITYAPRSGYTYLENESDPTKSILGDVIYPQVSSFLDKNDFTVIDNIPIGYGYGLCRLSGCDTKLSNDVLDPNNELLEKIKITYDWIETLSNNESDVISVKVFKIFAESIVGMLKDFYMKSIDQNKILSENITLNEKDAKDFANLYSFDKKDFDLGFHYIFDYAKTSDSITRVSHTGYVQGTDETSKTYEIKMGYVGEDKNGTQGIDVAETGSFIKGGDCDWVSISGVSRRPNESATIKFSFLPNTTDKAREGYIIIPSTQNTKLIYRFYQDVISSDLRIKYTDKDQITSYCGLNSVIPITVKNTEGTYIFDNICIVNTTTPDMFGKPSKIDKMLDYEIRNPYETGENIVITKVIRNEENQVLGFEVSFSNNDIDKNRVVDIYIREAGKTRNILHLKITQAAREFEFSAPTELPLKGNGRKGDSAQLELKGMTRDWELDILKGSNYIELSNNSGEITNESGKQDFSVTVTAKTNNIGSIAKEVALLKLHAIGDDTKSQKISIYQNGSMPESNLQGMTVVIPHVKGNIRSEQIWCSDDWEIVLDEKINWCSVSPENGKKCDKNNPTEIVFSALETTQSTDIREGTATLKYKHDGEVISTTEFTIRQEAAKFDFTLSGLDENGRVNLGDTIESDPAVIVVSSNYGWNIGIEYEDPSDKRFDACIDRVDGQLDGGVNGSSIYISVIKNSSNEESVKLGKIKIYALGKVVEQFDVYQDKVGVKISLNPGTTAGWYANGDSKQGGTQVTIPITFSPATATLSATYSIEEDTPSTAEIIKSEEDGKATIILPGIGSNPKGKETRTVSISAKADVGDLTKSATCKITQAGFSNGIRVTKDGSSTDYYGGSRPTETTYYFLPTKQSKIFTSLYIPIGAKSLNISVPNWLDYSKGTDPTADDYLLKIRETVAINETSSDRTGTITITSGSDKDITTTTIPVVQYHGTWIFGSSDEKFNDKYIYDNPYTLTIGSAENTDAIMTFVSSLSYNNKIENANCISEVIEGSDWLESSITWETGGNVAKVIVKSKTVNSTGELKTAIVKITQVDTERVFYIKVTQGVSTKLNISGGINGVKYVFINNNSSSIILNNTQAQTILNKATVIIGKGGTEVINSNGYILENIQYIDSTNGNISIKSINQIEKDEVLYLASIKYENNTVSGLSSDYCKNGDYTERVSFIPGKSTSSDITLRIQGFGSDMIKVPEFLDNGIRIIEGGYEYILTNSERIINWNTTSSGVVLSNDFWFFVSERDLDENGNINTDCYFSVDHSLGVRFFTETSTTQIASSKDSITLYMYKKSQNDSNNSTWKYCGTLLWTILDLEPTINWYI